MRWGPKWLQPFWVLIRWGFNYIKGAFMGLFGALIRTTVNVVTLPVSVVADIVTLGDAGGDEAGTYTTRKLQQIKDEAQED
jgi:hypothetical protein